MAQRTDKAGKLSNLLFIYLESCHERYIKKVEIINSLKLHSIGISCL